MRVVIQRVTQADVVVNHQTVGAIQKGLMILVGFSAEDSEKDLDYIVEKILHLRIFEDESGKMNLSVSDIKGQILSVPQFTLYADCRKGRRPGFSEAARPDIAIPLFELFNTKIGASGLVIETGEFGADMKVSLINDGPVTIILDSNKNSQEVQ